MGFRQQSQARIQLIQAAKHGQNAGLDKVWQTLGLGLGDQGLTVLDSYADQAWPVQISGRFKQLSHSYRYLALLGPIWDPGSENQSFTRILPGVQKCKTTYSKHFLYNLYFYTTISWNSTGITYLDAWRKLGSLGCCTSLYNVQPGKKTWAHSLPTKIFRGSNNLSLVDFFLSGFLLQKGKPLEGGCFCPRIPGFPKLCD